MIVLEDFSDCFLLRLPERALKNKRGMGGSIASIFEQEPDAVLREKSVEAVDAASRNCDMFRMFLKTGYDAWNSRRREAQILFFVKHRILERGKPFDAGYERRGQIFLLDKEALSKDAVHLFGKVTADFFFLDFS